MAENVRRRPLISLFSRRARGKRPGHNFVLYKRTGDEFLSSWQQGEILLDRHFGHFDCRSGFLEALSKWQQKVTNLRLLWTEL